MDYLPFGPKLCDQKQQLVIIAQILHIWRTRYFLPILVLEGVYKLLQNTFRAPAIGLGLGDE